MGFPSLKNGHGMPRCDFDGSADEAPSLSSRCLQAFIKWPGFLRVPGCCCCLGENFCEISGVEKPLVEKKQRKTLGKNYTWHLNKISSNHFFGVFPRVHTSMACNILVVPYHHCFCWFKCYFSGLRPLPRPDTLMHCL